MATYDEKDSDHGLAKPDAHSASADGDYYAKEKAYGDAGIEGAAADGVREHKLARQLKNRHVAMIS